jgi:hypothetical protein
MTKFLTALGNEVRKGLLFAWSERLQILLELPFSLCSSCCSARCSAPATRSPAATFPGR